MVLFRLGFDDGTEREYDTDNPSMRMQALSAIRSGAELITQEDLDELEQLEVEAEYTALAWEGENSEVIEVPEFEQSEVRSGNAELRRALVQLGQIEEDSEVSTGGELTWGIGQGLLTEGAEVVTDSQGNRLSELRQRFGLKDNESGRFVVEYKTRKGEERRWTFTLLPAIESNLSIGISSPISRGGGAKVPEARPGLMVQTVMKHKNLGIPGGTPVLQTVGPEMTVIQLVGAFVGDETDLSRGVDRSYVANLDNEGFGSGESALYATWGEALSTQFNSYEKARVFDREVVIQGAPVTLSVLSRNSNNFEGDDFINFTYECVVTGIKLYVARGDRTYYTLNALVTNYDIAEEYSAELEADRGESKKIAEALIKEQAEANEAEAEEEGEGEPEGDTTEEESSSGSLEDKAGEGEEPTSEDLGQSNLGAINDPSIAEEEGLSRFNDLHSVFENKPGDYGVAAPTE